MDDRTTEALVAVARTATPTIPLPDAFTPMQKPGTAYFGLVLPEMDAVLTSGVLVSESAQLLDATINFQLAQGKKHSVAVLRRPPKPNGPVSPNFLTRYQGHVANAFGAVWLTNEDYRYAPVLRPVPSAELDDLAARVRAELTANPGPAERPRSVDAEMAVIPIVDRPLREAGFQQAPRVKRYYQGFWRRPPVDCLWTRDHGEIQRLVLEVKIGEDQQAPLSQLAEGIGAFDAAIQVRLGPYGKRHEIPAAVNARMQKAKDLFEMGAPVRFLSWAAATF